VKNLHRLICRAHNTKRGGVSCRGAASPLPSLYSWRFGVAVGCVPVTRCTTTTLIMHTKSSMNKQLFPKREHDMHYGIFPDNVFVKVVSHPLLTAAYRNHFRYIEKKWKSNPDSHFVTHLQHSYTFVHR